MSTIDYILLGVAGLFEAFFFSLSFYLRVTRPVVGKVKKDDILRAQDAWVRKVDTLSKTFKPIIIHSVAGTALLGWVVYRIILSFI